MGSIVCKEMVDMEEVRVKKLNLSNSNHNAVRCIHLPPFTFLD